MRRRLPPVPGRMAGVGDAIHEIVAFFEGYDFVKQPIVQTATGMLTVFVQHFPYFLTRIGPDDPAVVVHFITIALPDGINPPGLLFRSQTVSDFDT